MVIDLFPTPVMILNLSDRMRSEDVDIVQSWGYNTEHAAKQSDPLKVYDDDFYFLDRKCPDLVLKDLLQECVNKFLHEVWREETNKLEITTSWINSIPAGRGLNRHIHRNSIISGAMYFKMDNGHSGFTLYNPMPRPVAGYTTKENRYTQDQIVLHPKHLDLILFPSMMGHSVDPHRENANRISLAFNTFYTGDIRSNPHIGKDNQGLDGRYSDNYGASAISRAVVTGRVS